MSAIYRSHNKNKLMTSRPWLLVSLLSTTLLYIISHFLIHHNNIPAHTTKALKTQPIVLPIQNHPVQTTNQAKNLWQTITTKPGDTLGHIFNRIGLNQRTLQQVLQHNPYAKQLANIKPNQTLKVLIHEHELEKIIFPISAMQFLSI